ncbi:MAG: histidinol-phosphate transaminase [Bacteroidia bacterium]|nr:histidinol-phosphate transaminase [Bacteroidia bacterium]
MNNDIQSLIRPHLRNIQPYSSARDEYSGWEGIFLDANENAFGTVSEGSHNRYPDPYQTLLKQKLSAIKGVSPNRIFLGNGSDEAIDLLFRAFCEPGEDEVLLLPPTYGMYQVSADINRVQAAKVPLTRDFQIHWPKVKAAIGNLTKLIFICSPNNPSGNLMDREDIEDILDVAPGLVVVDEAYIDFTPDATLIPMLSHFPRLVILQTFSKAWGMANLRLGMAFAHPEVISILNKIKPPYNINGLTQELASQALDNQSIKLDMVKETLKQRKLLKEALEQIRFVEKVYPSDANFLLVKVRNADRVYHQLIEKKVIVRNRSKVIMCEGCLRITIGTADENQKLLDELKNMEL